MTENNQEGQRERCEEASFVDENSAKLIQRVTSVMPIADELHSKGMIHDENYAAIKAKETDQDKMRKLFELLTSECLKKAFYDSLKKNEEHLFKELGGVSRKRKPSDPECSVPRKRLNTETNTERDNPNYNNARNSAPATTNILNNILIEQRPPHNMDNVVAKTERKPPVPKKEKKTPAPKKEKKTPAPKKEKKTPAPKKEKKTPAPKKEKKTPAPKKEKKTPAPKKKKTPAPKKEKKTPGPKKQKKTPAPKKKKTPAPKKQKKTPAPKKKKTPAPKKKKTPAPKKQKKTPAPKKGKKTPAPKKKRNS